MAAFESDLKRVLADQGHVLHAQLIGIKVLDASEASGYAGLAATFRARTCPAQALSGIGAAVTVLPRDDHDLTFAVDIDCERIGVGVFQVRLYRTLMTGSWRND